MEAEQQKEDRRKEEGKKEEQDVVYILQCGDGSFYTGWTNRLDHRLKQHQSGKGGKYTKAHLPVKLVYREICRDRHEAMHREWEIKQMTRSQKAELISRESLSDNSKEEL